MDLFVFVDTFAVRDVGQLVARVARPDPALKVWDAGYGRLQARLLERMERKFAAVSVKAFLTDTAATAALQEHLPADWKAVALPAVVGTVVNNPHKMGTSLRFTVVLATHLGAVTLSRRPAVVAVTDAAEVIYPLRDIQRRGLTDVAWAFPDVSGQLQALASANNVPFVDLLAPAPRGGRIDTEHLCGD